MVQKKKLDENATLLYRMGFRDPDLKLQSHDDIVLWLYNNDNIVLNIIESFYKTPTTSFKVIYHENDFEYIISNEKGYDLGFIDLKRDIECYDSYQEKEAKKKAFYTAREYITYYTMFFEAKTSYPTLGELMRQLQLYKKYTNDYDYDDRYHCYRIYFLVGPRHPTMKDFPEFLKQQGWIFVEIPFEIKKEENSKNNNKKTILDFGVK